MLVVVRLPESLRRLETAYCLGEEELVRLHGMCIGILGMPRSSLDVMLNLQDKQRRQELLLSAGQHAIQIQRPHTRPLG